MFRWLKKFLRIITILLPSFVGVVFFTNNSFATTVTCTDNFVSSTASFPLISSDCDTSTLDSTKDWFYTVDYSLDVSYSAFGSDYWVRIYPIVSCGSNCFSTRFPNPGDLISIPAPEYGTSYQISYVHIMSDTPTNRFVSLTKSHYIQGSSDYSSFLTINSFTVSDEFPSGGSSSTPEEPDCPEIPENPYDNKLDEIKYAIYAIGGVMLVIYFFYAIYKMIIGGTK